VPVTVKEGGRLAFASASAVATGTLRGTLGDLWGRVASAVPAIGGAVTGMVSKDVETKAAGYSILTGAVCATLGIEAADLGQIIRAKMRTPVAKQTVQPVQKA